MPENRKLLNRIDFLIIGIILAAALAVSVFIMISRDSDVSTCTIVSDGVETEVDLSKNRQFSLDEKPEVVFEVKDQSIAFIHSDCPDKVCVNTGYIKNSGEIAACLPNKILVKIVSDKPQDADEPDMIAK